MDWLDYRERLGLGFNDNDKVKYFMVKAFNLFDGLKNDYMINQISAKEYFDFCDVTGTYLQRSLNFKSGYDLIMEELEKHTSSIEEFLLYYLAFVNCQEDSSTKRWEKRKFINIICGMLKDSKIQYEIVEDTDGYFIFPKGAKELDDALVSQPLEWLKDYPNAHKTFVKALKSYSDANESTASDVADLFRKSLETFFQEFFNSTKSLENLKSEYGTYMKLKGIPNEISNNLETLQQAYTNFMNGYAKHHDKTSINVLEYIMYQTGNTIRLLITLKREDE